MDALKTVDAGGMHVVYDRWPEIGQEQFGADLEPVGDRRTGHVVFAGMGGSGTISDLFASILSKTGIHVDVVKGYLLPGTADPDSLVVATSISGDTVETLTVLEQAKRAGCDTISFSNGGRMKKFCLENGMQFREVPMYHSPRASFTSFLYSMLKVLLPILPVSRADIAGSLAGMRSLRDVIYSGNASGNAALDLARWLPGIPVVYYPWGLEAAAIRFKNSLQENAKMHVMAEDVIEACHNGIVPWSAGPDIKPVLIRGRDDYVKTQERWEILKEFFESRNIDYREVYSQDGSILAKLINLIYLLDYTSIYRAVLYGIDPTPVGAIRFIKNKV